MAGVLLVPHDPAWAAAFDREAAAVGAAFGDRLVALHHIGSTAIPGIRAKPILDLLGVVREIARVDDRAAGLEALGYEAMGEFGIPGRRYFRKEVAGTRTHHLHVFAAGSPQVERHLAFRDYLRAHPGDAARYDALKGRLADLHRDMAAYTAGKDEFIREIDARAAAWQAAAFVSDGPPGPSLQE